MSHKPLLLVILDGFGCREKTTDNAIANANAPFLMQLKKNVTYTEISGSGCDVGLPKGQMGNSEVGHLNIGGGRIVQQDFTRIETDIESGKFYKNTVLVNAVKIAAQKNKAVHILGLLSPGGVHSHETQIHAMIQLAAQQDVKQIFIHAFLDGRDTPPRSALSSTQALEKLLATVPGGKIASLIGRYYAMDRDHRWDRVQCAYDLLTQGLAERHAETAELGLQQAYAAEENDEFVKATAIHQPNESPVTIQDGDVVIFMNYRADRARELSHAFLDNPFSEFTRQKHPKLSTFVTLTQYDVTLKTPIAYPPLQHKNVLGELLAQNGLKQLRIAETEKYAHVTFFFNGGVETPFPGEERLLIPSPKVATYDLQPEMSAIPLTNQLVKAIQSKTFDVIICNYANPDMVGHTGNLPATIKAIETIDACLTRVDAALQAIGGEMIITADHGNAEKMYDETTKQAHTAHTSDPVPFVYLGRKAQVAHTHGSLQDIAPTLLYILGIPKPAEMTGDSLIQW